MADSWASIFVHSDHADGTTHSICKRCMSVVAQSDWEADLETAERAHVCNPERLAYLQNLQDNPLRARQPKLN
jgi:hypothetical protein